MNFRTVGLLAKWLACALAYVGLSVLVARGLYRVILWSTDLGSMSRLYQIEIRFAATRVCVACLFCGAVYLSAFAKPDSFGGIGRIWKHLGLSYALNVGGCVLLIRALYFSLPDFESNFVLSASAFAGLAIPVVCFLLALLVWVRLAFRVPDVSSPAISLSAES